MSNFLKRILTSLVLLPLVFVSVFYGDIIFTSFMLILISIGFLEYEKIIIVRSRLNSVCAYIGLILITVLAHIDLQLFLYSIFLVFLIWLIRILFGKIQLKDFWSSYFFLLFYIGSGVNFAILIRNSDNGLILLTFVLVVSSINDISAYLVGKSFGVRKAFPTVNPNKTYVGSIGGIVCSIIASVLMFEFLFDDIPIVTSMFIGLLISFLGIIGDFVESFIKRKSGIKDSGSILPGHGGILDRIDSLIFILPFFYVLSKYLV